jgi:outer membrane protein OmpA-like peptidoglycan-associated protein
MIKDAMLKILLPLMLIISCYTATASDTTSARIYFDFNHYQLTKTSQEVLDDVLPPDASITLTNIKIYGHTDQIGSNGYNQKLSIQRAKAVKEYLVGKGVNPNLITLVQGKGETELENPLLDAASRQQNRRVIVLIEYISQVKQDTIIINNKKPLPVIDTIPTKVVDTIKVETKQPTITEKIKDSSLKVGDNLVLRNINFIGSRHVLLPSSNAALFELLDAMKQIPTLEIEIQGHVCCTGNDGDGFDLDTKTSDLSWQRAKAVQMYLVLNDISPKRMRIVGYGHKRPLTAERTDAERTANRRVEIKILKK